MPLTKALKKHVNMVNQLINDTFHDWLEKNRRGKYKSSPTEDVTSHLRAGVLLDIRSEAMADGILWRVKILDVETLADS